MVIRKIEIENVRSLAKVSWAVEAENAVGWHVILGDNGAGKSTFLRAVALALVGPTEAAALRQNWRDWLRFGEWKSRVELSLEPNNEWDKFLTDTRRGKILHMGVEISRAMVVEKTFKTMQDGTSLESLSLSRKLNPNTFIWGGAPGWFCASYGPFRRFSGGDKESEVIFESNPRLAPHLSVFGENVALSEAQGWLKDLHVKKLEGKSEGGLLDDLITFINQPDFLPHGAKLKEVSSDGIEFVDGNNNVIYVEDLSDGYRSILSMTFELIRQMSRAYYTEPHQIFDPKDATKIIAPGVVLIDEIDVHLHPSWQRRIGGWLLGHFPNVQFIVTTHSPLVCQAATQGSVFKLPKPGTDEVGAMVTGIELERLLKGNVLEALDTPAFGLHLTRSDESRREMKRLAQLNIKELRGPLSPDEQQEQEALRATLPTVAHTTALNGQDKTAQGGTAR